MTTTAKKQTTLSKVVHVGSAGYGQVFCKIEIEDGELRISGVEGPMRNGDAKGGCGQIVDTLKSLTAYAPGWDAGKVRQFVAYWRAWHLNGMRAGCEHQRTIDTSEKVEVVSYKLTSDAYHLRNQTLSEAATAALKGVPFTPNPTAKALALNKNWFSPIFAPPDDDSPLSGCYEVEKREMKSIGWTRPNEHPKGLLGKACDVCGYKYGSAWLKEELPQHVVDFMAALPDTDIQPAWV